MCKEVRVIENNIERSQLREPARLKVSGNIVPRDVARIFYHGLRK